MKQFDNIDDALREVVQRAGGLKTVGALLWPELEAGQAGRRLADCLNSDRRELLNPAQVVYLLRIGRQVGCHAGMHYIADESGYQHPDPIEQRDERARLQREFIASIHTLTELAARIESMDARDVPGIRSVS